MRGLAARIAWIALSAALAAGDGARAQDAPGAEAAPAPAPAPEEDLLPPPVAQPLPANPGPAPDPWRPPLLAPEELDWLQLNSGEWLRGELEQIKDEKVYFDSEELDDLEIDWDDVAELRSPRRHTYRFEGREIVTGTAGMRRGVVRVDTGEEVEEFPREELVSMIEGEPSEWNYWSGKLSLGFAGRRGNTRQVDLTIYGELSRETPLTRLLATYNAAVSGLDGQETANTQRLSGSFDIYVTRRFYATVPAVEWFRDPFQNIDLRFTPGAGVGYDLWKRKQVDWNVSGLVAYQRTNFITVPPGESSRADDAALIFGTELDLDPTSDIEWDTTYQLQLVVTDLGKTNHHLTSILSVDLFGPIDLDVTFNWDRVESPKPDDLGEVPVSDDYRLSVGLGVDF